VFPAASIVVGERSFASWRPGTGTGRAGEPQLRHGWRICGDGPEQQSKGAVRPLESRGDTQAEAPIQGHTITWNNPLVVSEKQRQ
jgi:hypothetical protein